MALRIQETIWLSIKLSSEMFESGFGSFLSFLFHTRSTHHQENHETFNLNDKSDQGRKKSIESSSHRRKQGRQAGKQGTYLLCERKSDDLDQQSQTSNLPRPMFHPTIVPASINPALPDPSHFFLFLSFLPARPLFLLRYLHIPFFACPPRCDANRCLCCSAGRDWTHEPFFLNGPDGYRFELGPLFSIALRVALSFCVPHIRAQLFRSSRDEKCDRPQKFVHQRKGRKKRQEENRIEKDGTNNKLSKISVSVNTHLPNTLGRLQTE